MGRRRVATADAGQVDTRSLLPNHCPSPAKLPHLTPSHFPAVPVLRMGMRTPRNPVFHPCKTLVIAPAPELAPRPSVAKPRPSVAKPRQVSKPFGCRLLTQSGQTPPQAPLPSAPPPTPPLRVPLPSSSYTALCFPSTSYTVLRFLLQSRSTLRLALNRGHQYGSGRRLLQRY